MTDGSIEQRAFLTVRQHSLETLRMSIAFRLAFLRFVIETKEIIIKMQRVNPKICVNKVHCKGVHNYGKLDSTSMTYRNSVCVLCHFSSV